MILCWSEACPLDTKRVRKAARETISTATDFKLLPESFPDVEVTGMDLRYADDGNDDHADAEAEEEGNTELLAKTDLDLPHQ